MTLGSRGLGPPVGRLVLQLSPHQRQGAEESAAVRWKVWPPPEALQPRPDLLRRAPVPWEANWAAQHAAPCGEEKTTQNRDERRRTATAFNWSLPERRFRSPKRDHPRTQSINRWGVVGGVCGRPDGLGGAFQPGPCATAVIGHTWSDGWGHPQLGGSLGRGPGQCELRCSLGHPLGQLRTGWIQQSLGGLEGM